MREEPIRANGVAILGDGDEQARIRALQAGSEEAFDWLVAEYAAAVFRLSYRILNDRAEAADTVQEVFLKVFRKIAEFQGDSSLKTWIYRIALNTAANQNRWWRRHKEQVFSLDAEEEERGDSTLVVADHSRSPFELLLSRETQEMVREALARLPGCSRTVLVLREMEGLSYEEIAAILHLSLGTVKSRLARARLALRNELESMEIAPSRMPVWNPAE